MTFLSYHKLSVYEGDTDCCILSADRVVLGVAWEENESDSSKLCSEN